MKLDALKNQSITRRSKFSPAFRAPACRPGWQPFERNHMNPIRELRLAAGLTQVEAAARAKTTQSRWSTWEAKKSLDHTELGVLQRIAGALSVPLARLITAKHNITTKHKGE